MMHLYSPLTADKRKKIMYCGSVYDNMCHCYRAVLSQKLQQSLIYTALSEIEISKSVSDLYMYSAKVQD